MKLLPFLSFLLLALFTTVQAEAPKTSSGQPQPPETPYASFFALPKDSAATQGTALAESDFKNGIYRILTYGKPASFVPSRDYLRKHYGVESFAIVGCMVTDGLLSGADAYNSTMRTLLNRKFKKDIFAEAEEKNK